MFWITSTDDVIALSCAKWPSDCITWKYRRQLLTIVFDIWLFFSFIFISNFLIQVTKSRYYFYFYFLKYNLFCISVNKNIVIGYIVFVLMYVTGRRRNFRTSKVRTKGFQRLKEHFRTIWRSLIATRLINCDLLQNFCQHFKIPKLQYKLKSDEVWGLTQVMKSNAIENMLMPIKNMYINIIGRFLLLPVTCSVTNTIYPLT